KDARLPALRADKFTQSALRLTAMGDFGPPGPRLQDRMGTFPLARSAPFLRSDRISPDLLPVPPSHRRQSSVVTTGGDPWPPGGLLARQNRGRRTPSRQPDASR